MSDIDDKDKETIKTYSEKQYADIKDDMFKYKTAGKDKDSKIAELQAQIESAKTVELEQKQEYKTLFEAEKAKNVELLEDSAIKDEKFVTSHKINAVIEELGGFKKTEYVKFVDTSKVLVDDNGVVDKLTVDSEVKRIRQEYPELLKASKGGKLPSDAPRGSVAPKKSLGKMNRNEINDLRRSQIETRLKQQTN